MERTQLNQLNQSAVHFDEVKHTYSLDGKILSGITSIIHKYILPNMYSGISQAVLNKAAERGTRIHNLVQLWTMGILSEEDTAELQPFMDAYAAAGLDGCESEYLVSDNESVASSIDLVCLDREGNIILCDIKTTSVLNIEYLQWQLSIYAYLFEKQNETLKVSALKAIHFRDGKCAIVDIERIADEHVAALITAFRNGDEAFVNPLHEVPAEMTDLFDEYGSVEVALAEIDAAKKPLEERKKQIQERLAEILREKGLQKIETDQAKVTVGSDSITETFDFKSFCKTDTYNDSPDKFNGFVKKSVRKGRVTVTLK
ncbi:MAG: hypothetical protein IJ640_00145 [Prevotella sp.]|nr:hypothetical protein [Prevotella sp.]